MFKMKPKLLLLLRDDDEAGDGENCKWLFVFQIKDIYRK